MKLTLEPLEKSTDASDAPTGYQVVTDEPFTVEGRETRVVMCDEPFYNIAPSKKMAELLVAAFNVHDQMATALTEARKAIHSARATEGFQSRALLDDAILTLNLCILAHRKFAKGEVP